MNDLLIPMPEKSWSLLFTGDDTYQSAGVFSGLENTSLSLATLVVSEAKVLLLDEPTNPPDPASREEILRALATLSRAVVLVSHDVGAVTALNPERLSILLDDDEDHWNEEYLVNKLRRQTLREVPRTLSVSQSQSHF